MLTPQMLEIAVAIVLAVFASRAIGHGAKKLGHGVKAAAVHVMPHKHHRTKP